MSQAFQYIHFLDRALIPKGFNIISPLSGVINEVTAHEQALFHCGVMGPGSSFHLTGHTLHSPFNGVISNVSPDGNQLLFTASNGLQLLLRLFGEAQCLLVNDQLPKLYEGRKVTQGELLAYVETRRLQRKQSNQQAVVCVFNAEYFGKVYCGAKRVTAAEDTLFTVTPRNNAST